MTHPTDFRSPAYRSLITTLGETDATVEWIEVCVRELERVGSRSRGKEIIKAAANRHSVFVYPMDVRVLKQRWGRLGLLAAYTQFEYFLDGFRKTHPRRVQYKRPDGEDKLSPTLRAFDLSSKQVGQLEFDLCTYYRVLRNFFMHDAEGNQGKENRTLCLNLRKQINGSQYNGLNAPNFADELSFDDFVLFTRAIKRIASNLCSLTVPTDDELTQFARADERLLGKLRFLTNNPTRAENASAKFFRQTFSIPEDRSNALGKMVVKLGPLAQR
jgi:hypothetical protein